METITQAQKDKSGHGAKRLSGAEAVVKCLLSEGVDLIYGYPGGAIMPVYDEFYKYEKELHHVLTRHEQGAVHAAQGFARVTGKVGVAIATSGPGATNLITGLADAQIDSTPLVCITGQVGSHLLGSDAFQETDIVSISTPVTKWNHQITRAEEIPEVFAKAFYIAKSGRPGPVLIDITKDAQFGELDFIYEKCTEVRSYVPVPPTEPETLKQAAELINGAKKSQQVEANLNRLTSLSELIEVLPFDQHAAVAYGDVRSDLEKRGLIIGGNDLLIAAHAINLNLTLVTNNEREFSRIKDLIIENWVQNTLE